MPNAPSPADHESESGPGGATSPSDRATGGSSGNVASSERGHWQRVEYSELKGLPESSLVTPADSAVATDMPSPAEVVAPPIESPQSLKEAVSEEVSDSEEATPEIGLQDSPLEGHASQPQESTGSHGDTNRVVPAKPKLRLERRQELEQHLRSSPTDLDAYLELAAIYRADDRPLEAKKILQQALQTFPDDTTLHWEFEEATLARSLQQLREVAELARRLDTLETERELKRSQNDWACRRMDVCRARLKRDPSLLHLKVVLAEALFDAELYEAAVDEVDEVLDNDDLSPQAYLIRGRSLLALARETEAMVALRAASMRRAVIGPVRTRVMALRLLCDTAERLGIELTLQKYRQHLAAAEKELSERSHRNGATPTSSN